MIVRMGPLAGLRVLEFEAIGPAPFAGIKDAAESVRFKTTPLPKSHTAETTSRLVLPGDLSAMATWPMWVMPRFRVSLISVTVPVTPDTVADEFWDWKSVLLTVMAPPEKV